MKTGFIARHRRPAWQLVATCVVVLAGWAATPAVATAAPHHEASDDILAFDRQIEVLLERLADGRLDEAEVLARQLARDWPSLRLAQLLQSEFASLHALEPGRVAGGLAWSEPLLDLLLEARTRLDLAAARDPAVARGELLPSALLRLGNDIRDVVLVDLSASELLHYRVHGGVPTLASRHYVSSGSAGFGKRVEGDLKTPLGVYRIRGFRPDHTLPELYGAGALTLNYPNALDRALGRTGSGIWLHGVPRANDSRAPFSSEGCVTMSNPHLETLAAELDRPATVVLLADSLRWLTPDAHARHAAARLETLADDRAVPRGGSVFEVPAHGAITHLAVRVPAPDEPLGARWSFPEIVPAPATGGAVAQLADVL